jgi:hypothetical protein
MICFLVVDPIVTFFSLCATLRLHSWYDENLVENRYSHIKEYEHRTKCKWLLLVPDFQHVSYLVYVKTEVFFIEPGDFRIMKLI